MTGVKSRLCPTCGELRSGKAFKNSDQCTDCRRDPDRSTPPDKCSKCQAAFEPASFHFEKIGRGWRKECKSCHGKVQKEYYASIEERPPRTCKRCGDSNAAIQFNGPRNLCRTCKAIQAKEASSQAPAADPSTLAKPQVCSRCDRKMCDEDLTLRTDTHGGSYRTCCKSCLALATDGSNHSQNSRKRQREGDDHQAIRARNNAGNREWHAKHPHKSAEYQARYRAAADSKMRQVLHSAKQRGMDIVEDDIAAMQVSLLDPCFYCDYSPATDQPLNGLARADVAIKVMSLVNTVPCCAACSHIRGPYSNPLFLRQARVIAALHPHGDAAPAETIDRQYRALCSHARTSPDKTDSLDQDERIQLLSSRCYLCGQGPAVGIDRVDSGAGYDMENCKPCCVICNYMKSAVDFSSFIGKVRDIARHTGWWVLEDIQQATHIDCRTIAPLQAVRSDGAILAQFPSRGVAARALGTSTPTISSNVGKEWRGAHWEEIDIGTYLGRQPLEASIVAGYLRQAATKVNTRKPAAGSKPRRGRTVVVTAEDGEEHTFVSLSDAARYLGCSQQALSKAPDVWREQAVKNATHLGCG